MVASPPSAATADDATVSTFDAALAPASFDVSRLPPEVVGNVAEFAAMGCSWQGAREIALVSRAFCAPALRVAWTRIALSNLGPENPFDRRDRPLWDPPTRRLPGFIEALDAGADWWAAHVRWLSLSLWSDVMSPEADAMADRVARVLRACPLIDTLTLTLCGASGRILERADVIKAVRCLAVRVLVTSEHRYHPGGDAYGEWSGHAWRALLTAVGANLRILSVTGGITAEDGLLMLNASELDNVPLPVLESLALSMQLEWEPGTNDRTDDFVAAICRNAPATLEFEFCSDLPFMQLSSVASVYGAGRAIGDMWLEHPDPTEAGELGRPAPTPGLPLTVHRLQISAANIELLDPGWFNFPELQFVQVDLECADDVDRLVRWFDAWQPGSDDGLAFVVSARRGRYTPDHEIALARAIRRLPPRGLAVLGLVRDRIWTTWTQDTPLTLAQAAML